jgi:Zn-dependent alcohol dehydrogenase
VLISAAVLMAADAPCAIEQVQLNDPGPGEVLVKIAGVGLCPTYLLSQISQAEADAASGAAVKPALIPDPLA